MPRRSCQCAEDTTASDAGPRVGQKLRGRVSSLHNLGAFVDIGGRLPMSPSLFLSFFRKAKHCLPDPAQAHARARKLARAHSRNNTLAPKLAGAKLREQSRTSMLARGRLQAKLAREHLHEQSHSSTRSSAVAFANSQVREQSRTSALVRAHLSAQTCTRKVAPASPMSTLTAHTCTSAPVRAPV